MSDILARLKAGTSNRRATTWPGTDVAIELRPLSEQDYLDAGMAVDNIYAKSAIQIGMHNIQDYEAEKTTQLLMRAVCDPETHKPLTTDIGGFRRLLVGQGVKEQLVAELEEHTRQCSPRIAEMPADELEALMLRLKKTPDETVTSVSSISSLRKLVLSLVAQRHSLPMDSGSTS